MTFDPLTGYTLTFVFLVASAILNFTVYFSTGRHRFFLIFSIYQVLWVTTLAGILIQSVAPVAGILITNIPVPISLVLLIEACTFESKTLLPWRRVLYIAIIASHYIVVASELLFIHNFTLRSVFSSFIYTLANLLALIFAVRSGFIGVAGRTKGNIVIFVTLAIDVVAWAARGIITVSAPPVSGLLSQGASTTITLLLFPPLIYLLNAGFLARVIEIANKEKDALTQRALMAEHDAMFVDLLGNLNHELNTPLGNARIGASMLSDKLRDNEQTGQVMSGINKSLEQMAEIIGDRNRFLSRDANLSVAIYTDELFSVFSRLMKRNVAGQKRINFELENSIQHFRSTWRFVFSLLFITTEVLGRGIEGDHTEQYVSGGINGSKKSGSSKISLRFDRRQSQISPALVEISVRHDTRYLLSDTRNSLNSRDRDLLNEFLPAEASKRMVWLAEYLETPYDGGFEVRREGEKGESIVLSFREVGAKDL